MDPVDILPPDVITNARQLHARLGALLEEEERRPSVPTAGYGERCGLVLQGLQDLAAALQPRAQVPA